MLRKLHSAKNKIPSFILAAVLTIAQFAPAIAVLSTARIATAAPVCVNDTAGANDEPGQKDLTRLCVDYANVPTTVSTTLNWDNLGTSGANTLDACNLFDTDNDGNINYAVCVTTINTPAQLQSLTTYSCGDAKIDRCTTPATPVSSGTTSCTISQKSTDPFPSGTSSPLDTEAACTIQLSTVGGSSAKLIDVCSYPSAQPNSDPSDCVIAQNNSGKIEVVKNLSPTTDSGLFNLVVDGPGGDDFTQPNQTHNGTTGEVVVSTGSTTVSETAGTNTNLANYSTSITCRDLNGSGSVVAQGTATSLAVNVADDADVVCTITNTARSSITIIKDARPNDAENFSFTASGSGVSNFSLDDDSDPALSNTRQFTNLSPGSYSFTEQTVDGWDLTGINCGGAAGTSVNGATVNITLAAGQNISCTYTNAKRGTITVNKVTDPANDPTAFSVTASGTGTITGNATRSLSTSQSVTYNVGQGTYSVSESVPSGWAQTVNTCTTTNLVINENNLSRTCTITNTKLAKLKIVKNATPDGPQIFNFSTTGSGLSGFFLDDNTDPTYSNEQQFIDLMPGSYTVSEAQEQDWDLTNLNCGTGVQFTRTNNTLGITLAAGADVTCTFTNTQRGSIQGYKFNDLNGNGVFDQGEPTLSGWTIFIDGNANGILDSGEMSSITDLTGSYSFLSLISGTYNLAEQLLSGWTQTLAPLPVQLAAGQNSTNNNFGNFQNGSISGLKFNDLNGNRARDNNDPTLSGWTINLYNDNDDADQLYNNLVTSTTTAGDGTYSFTNLPPGTYQVCEVQQTGWVQTLPDSGACYTVIINQSGETNPGTNFGNQGRGTITVVKNVDTDGDGDIDQSDVGTYTWDIDGTGNYATGSTNTQSVAAGSYTVSEDQQTNYHVSSSSCTGEQAGAASESVSATVSPGENVTCTFVNTRDTGTLRLIKEVENGVSITGNKQASDFNMHVTQDGVDVTGSPQAGSSTGTVYTLPTGNYEVSEDTPPTGYYQSGVECDGQEGNSATVTTNDEVICTITNTKLPSLNVIKDSQPDHEQDFEFTIDESDGILSLLKTPFGLEEVLEEHLEEFTLDDDDDETLSNQASFTDLLPGAYVISEESLKGWSLDNIDCGEGVTFVRNDDSVTVTLLPGAVVTCTFVNEQVLPELTVIKQVINDDGANKQAGDFTMYVEGNNVSDGEFPGEAQGTVVTLDPGDYSVREDQLPGYSASFSENCFGTVELGDKKTCTVTNNDNPPVVNITKSNDQPTATQVGETVVYTLVVDVPQDSGVVYNAEVTDLPPDHFRYVAGSWTANSTFRGNLKSLGITPEPTYSSPGVWTLGDLMPGERIVLTYATLIEDVTPGTYPDTAFVRGQSNDSVESEEVLGNMSVAATPFVGTEVSVVRPADSSAFEAPNVENVNLVNTGSSISPLDVILPLVLIAVTLYCYLSTRQYARKGADK